MHHRPLSCGAGGGSWVVGFSQGGALALFTGLQTPEPLAGILCMSAYLPRAESIVATPAAATVPVLFCHGEADPVVPIPWARLSSDRVKALGVRDVSFKSYRGMAHSSSEAELRDATAFLERVLPAAPAGGGGGGSGAVPRPPTADAIAAMSSGELKRFLTSAGVDPSRAIEKGELVALALRAAGHTEDAGKL